MLGRDRAWLLAHDDASLSGEQAARLEALVARRRAGEPVAYLLGEKEFHGLTLQVDARVLVPRPDTEVLVDWAIELLRGELAAMEQPAVLDLGTGSGAIALAVKHDLPLGHAHGHRCQQRGPERRPNQRSAARSGRRVPPRRLVAGRGDRRFHLALSNPPHIASADPHLAALTAEPGMALTPGPEGLEALRAIVAGSAATSKPAAGCCWSTASIRPRRSRRCCATPASSA